MRVRKSGPVTPIDVADVEQLERRVDLLAQRVLLEVQLNPPALVGEVRERRLPVRAPRDDAPRHADDVALALLIRRMQAHRVGRGVRAVEPVRERLHAACDERVELLAPRATDEVRLVAHATPPRSTVSAVAAGREVRLDKGIDVPIHDALHVRDLQFGAVIVHHRVRLEDVAANLVAEAHVRFRRVELRLFLRLPLGLELVESVLQHLHRRAFVLVLRAFLLRRHDDSRRDVREADRGARLVDVLTARARRAEDVHPDVLVADLDVDLVVDDRIHEHRREARVPPSLRVERRDAHEPVHADLGLQKPERVRTFDLEHGALDARLFAVAHVEDVDGVALSLGPPRVHPHEHRRPVLRLGPAGARADLELRVAVVVRPGEKRAKSERLDLGPQHRRFSIELGRHLGVRLRLQHLIELTRALDPATDRVERLDPALD